MTNVAVPSIAVVSPGSGDSVLGVQGGAVKRMGIAALADLTPALRGRSGATFKLVSGVIRYNNTSHVFELISGDGTHQSTGIASIATDASKIRVTFDFTASNVSSAQVTMDESYSGQGFICGASVTTTYLDIYVSKIDGVSDYVFYNGSAWVSNGGVFTSMSMDAGGILTLNHAAVQPSTRIGGSVSGRQGNYVPQLESGSVSTQTLIAFYDFAGTKATTANSNMKAYVARAGVSAVDPTSAAMNVTNADIWITAVMEA